MGKEGEVHSISSKVGEYGPSTRGRGGIQVADIISSATERCVNRNQQQCILLRTFTTVLNSRTPQKRAGPSAAGWIAVALALAEGQDGATPGDQWGVGERDRPTGAFK